MIPLWHYVWIFKLKVTKAIHHSSAIQGTQCFILIVSLIAFFSIDTRLISLCTCWWRTTVNCVQYCPICITGECSIVTWRKSAWQHMQLELYVGNNNCQFWKPLFKTFHIWTVNWFMRQVRMCVLHSKYQIFFGYVEMTTPSRREGKAILLQ